MLSFVSNTLLDKKIPKLYYLDDYGEELLDFDEDTAARGHGYGLSGMLNKG